MKLFKRNRLENPYQILLNEDVARDIIKGDRLSDIRLDQIRRAMIRKWGEELGVPPVPDRPNP